ncbi:hypothetical protein [Proteus terrae]|uniref:hypothetical protein n=1 Tax=Proteus terrae TaxID=1574161 RepID=UPI0035260150
MTSLADKVRKAAERLRNLNKDELISMLDKAGIAYEEIDSAGVVRINNVIKDFSAEEGRLFSSWVRASDYMVRGMESFPDNETDLKHYQRVCIGGMMGAGIISLLMGRGHATRGLVEGGSIHANESLGALESHMALAMLPRCKTVSLNFSDFNDAEHSQNHGSLEYAYYSLQERGERVIPVGHEVMDFDFIANSGDREDERGILTH